MHSCLGAVLTQNKTGNPVQNPLKTVAASVEVWIRKKLDPIPPFSGKCIAVQPETVPIILLRSYLQGLRLGSSQLSPSTQGREDTCDGAQSWSWGPPCAPVPWQTQVPPISPDFPTQHKGIQGWVVLFVVNPTPPDT